MKRKRKQHTLLLETLFEQYKAGDVKVESEKEFQDRASVNHGAEATALVSNRTSAAYKSFRGYFGPFYNMISNRLQICLADIAFMGVVCDVQMLNASAKPALLQYNGTFSDVKFDSSAPNTIFIRLNEGQLSELGKNIIACLNASPRCRKKNTTNLKPNF